MKQALILLFSGWICIAAAQENINTNKFRQLGQELPTPNVYRTASGAPGHEYYQQKADYDMDIELDDETQRLFGTSTITYHNNSPDQLTYLWLQLDQNVRAQDSDTRKIRTMELSDERVNLREIAPLHSTYDGGFKIEYVKDASGRELPYRIVNTMMRVDLPKVLKPNGKTSIRLKWWYNINDRMEIGGRSGYEYFPEDENYLYTIAQFFPRMCVYNEVEGWQHKQFLGRGEFALPFGDYKVDITVPADHVVGATGFCQNYNQVLSSEHMNRFNEAKTADEPVVIVTQTEAEENEKEGTKEKKTWTFKATNVRDFAFASSRKFIWDAIGVDIGGKKVMAMSYYPKEGNPLWEQYSTRVVAHTLKTYSRYTIDYPYPVAISVHAKAIGMEYPMICFNFGRPEKDGTYSDYIKYRMIGVIIHEVGHNFFPMIINSDERQWTWMDEGLNSFVEYLASKEWDKDFPSRRGPAYKIVDYMKGDKSGIMPIMTNSESIFQFGNNAYGKPATALNILRESVLGRELFDHAFKEYAQRWAFKHPTPADLFRTMEDASGVDLDWFWRGWFYTTDHCDQRLDGVKWFQASSLDPRVEKPLAKKRDAEKETYISDVRNKDAYRSVVEKDAKTRDFYDNEYDRFGWFDSDVERYERNVSDFDEDEKKLLGSGTNYYQVDISSPGGLVMPVILEFEFADGAKEVHRIPAEIWKMNDKEVSKVFVSEKELVRVVLDPFLETADIDRGNNYWPPKVEPTRFELFKYNNGGGKNAMQKARDTKR